MVGSRGLIRRLSLSVAPARRHLGFLYLVGEDGMSQNALLRSVKGLGIPGTARKEDKKTKLKVAAPAPTDAGHGFRLQGLPLEGPFRGAQRRSLRRRPSDHRSARRRRASTISSISRRRCGGVSTPPTPRCCISICITSSRAASRAWRCWRKATSRSTLGRRSAMPRWTSSCAARPSRKMRAGAARGLFRKTGRRQRAIARRNRLSGPSRDKVQAAGWTPGRFVL